ncbi:hypothetical protein EDB87DRAFT_1728875 [Lactarius vividus]|nr:hypothetical protein EDB87DRAFT_1728875 [Lactarius vividus]
MSQNPPTSTLSSNFRSIFVATLKEYEKKTKTDLHTHPLAMQLQSCNSSSDIIAVLHDKVNEFDQARNHNERLSSWLNPTINVLYAIFAAPGEGIGLVSLNLFSASVGVLLLVSVFLELFMKGIFKRLEYYTEVLSTNAMTDIIVKIMAKVLNIFAIATKEMKLGRASVLPLGKSRINASLCPERFLRKSVGRKNIEDALKRLDKLTQEEARMAVAQILNLTHGVDDKVTDVRNQLRDVDDKIHVVMKGRKGGSSANFKQRRRHEMFVINPFVTAPVF